MSALRDIRGGVVVRCLHCRHEGRLSRPARLGATYFESRQETAELHRRGLTLPPEACSPRGAE
jgi:hypothetical protein